MHSPPKKTFRKRLRIWWHYHWISLFIALGALVLLIAVVRSQISQIEPDYRIGVVARLELPADTVEALKNALLPFCTDQNGDGHTTIELAQYTVDFDSAREDTNAYSQMAGVIKLSSDLQNINGCGIFLIEDAEGFVRESMALRYLDSTLPKSDSESIHWEKMCFLWKNCPVLTSLELGTYRGYTLMDTREGAGQDVLADFYLGRKAIPFESYTQKDHAEEKLWLKITKNAS